MSLLNKIKSFFIPKKEKSISLPDSDNEIIKILTAREYETFLLLLNGYTLKFCAEKMGIKYSTANTYQNAIYKKLGVTTRAKLIINYKDMIRSDSDDLQKL